MFLLLFVIICILCILYRRKLNAYWKNRSVPYAESNILHDIKMFTIGTKNIGFEIEDVYKKFPNQRFFGFYQLSRPSLMIRDPSLIYNMFITDFAHFYDRQPDSSNSKIGQHLFLLQGQKWKNLRIKLVPTFTSSKLKLMLYMMEHCSEILHTGIKWVARLLRNLRITKFANTHLHGPFNQCIMMKLWYLLRMYYLNNVL